MDYRVAIYGFLEDVKKRLMRIAVVLIVGLMIGWYAAYMIIANLKSRMLPDDVELIALTPLEFVIVQMKLSVVLVVIAFLPYIAHLLLKRFNVKKSRPALLFWGGAFGASFLAGAMFGYYLLLPRVIQFLTGNMQGAGMEPLYSINDFVFFAMSMMLIFGLVFEFPVVTVLLTRAGVISPKTLSEKRRYSYVGFFVVAAVLTPDPLFINQTIIALMFIFFYELSIIVSKIMGAK